MSGNDLSKISEREASRKRVADAVIEALAESEAELREHNASLQADVSVYRELALVGLHSVTKLTAQLATARREITRLRAAVSRPLTTPPATPPAFNPADAVTVQ